MADTFTWPVEVEGTGGAGTFAVGRAQFGDGYSQHTPLGINNEKQTWSVVRTDYEAKLQEVIDFIRDKQGAESFFWTPPLSGQIRVICTGWAVNNVAGKMPSLKMEFEQVYQP